MLKANRIKTLGALCMLLVSLVTLLPSCGEGEKIVYATVSYPSYKEYTLGIDEFTTIAEKYDACTWVASNLSISFDSRYGTPSTFQLLVYNGDDVEDVLIFGVVGDGSKYVSTGSPITIKPRESHLATFVFSIPESDLPLYEAFDFQLYFDVYQGGTLAYRSYLSDK